MSPTPSKPRFALALTLFLACTTAGLPAAAQQTDVTIGVSSRSFNPGFANMWIGVPLGLYGSLTPKVIGTQGASENLQLMLSDRLTMSTGTQDAIFNSAAEGRALPAVMPCVYLRGLVHRMSVTPNSPITDYAALKGKTIGVPTLAYGGVGYLKFALQHAGIKFDEVNLIAVGDGQQAAVALTSGRIDALLNADVDVARLQKLGVNVRVLDTPKSMTNALTAYVFAFSRPWYEKNKIAATELLKGMIRSIIVLSENPEAAVKISYHMYPQAIPAGIPLNQAISDAIEAIKVRAPLIDRNAGDNNRWCSFSKENWEGFVEILGLKGKVNPMDYYTDELIESINSIDEAGLRKWARELRVPDKEQDFQAWVKTLKAPL